jgi:hypothetical protein
MSPHSTEQPISSTRQRRKPTMVLSELLDFKLGIYALAAGAACVSVTAVAQEPENSIGYTQTDIYFGAWRDGPPPIYIDFNNDGVNDVTITEAASGYNLGSLSISYYQGVVSVKGLVIRRSLEKGMVVGPRGNFGGGGEMLRSVFRHSHPHTYGRAHCTGPFKGSASNQIVKYMGAEFSISGETHYAWIRLTASCQGNGTISGHITGYAYEKEANKGIAAGQTYSGMTDDAMDGASLGALSLGVDGLDFWRK